MPESLPLAGTCAFVTGGGKGIGRAICVGLAQAGALVALTGRTDATGPGTASATAVEIEAFGGTALPLVCDVRDPKAVRSAVDQMVARFGRLDVLVNNAGLFHPGHDIGEIDIELWAETIDTHLTGSFLCARAAIPHLIGAGGGSIVNLSSTAGDRSHDATGNVAYAVAKAGIEQFTRGLAMELARDNIAVNAIRPMALLSEGSMRHREWRTAYCARKRIKPASPEGNAAWSRHFTDPSAIVPAIVHLAQCRAEFSGHVVRRTDFADGRFASLV